MCNDGKDLSPILKELFPSAEMASYLAKCPFGDDVPCNRNYLFDDAPPEKLPLYRYMVEDAITGAPISLERKRELFLWLAEGEEDGYFSTLADAVSLAIQEMQPKPGEFFYLTVCSYEKDIACTREETMGAFLSWEQIFEAIQKCWGSDADFEQLLTWFYVEKWTPDGNGRLENKYTYEVVGGKVCYCCEDLSVHERLDLGGYTDPNLPVPFHAGDILTIDCRPFREVHHVVILEVGDNCDCCCLQALHYAGSGTWDIGAVKHGSVFPNGRSPSLSPLYRLASFHGQLPEEERLLKKVSRYVNGDEERGTALWNYIFHLEEEIKQRAVTEDQILSYFESDHTK